ncbi:hypothetical protein CR194_15305 [Salipaludibacillus keqinensis]|uniref:Uncharacterized protein n=1 Tax=Salipaludibacillus keqinensis TaxID=2045207 RepID=A0A323TEQ0_9BACI|nr:hypothetical protein [Salipaludibacillus keqinensis]PYZ92207.1 hypothetical protein CR194_15305 [Salipaludibacillus keqinensis]
MGNVKELAAFVFIACLLVGIGLSMAISKSEATYQTVEGDIGYLMNTEEIESGVFDRAFDADFRAKVRVTEIEKVESVSALASIYENGERVAQYSLGQLSFDEQFPFNSEYITFAAGGLNGLAEDGEGYYWTHVIRIDESSLKSELDLTNEGEFTSWLEYEASAVNDGEPVIFGIGVIEGNDEYQSYFNDRDEFYSWANEQEKIVTFELLVSSSGVEVESWDHRDDE